MQKDFKETLIFTIGGSLVVPDMIDTSFLRDLKSIVEKLIQQNYQVVLVIGGGKTARRYQEAAREFEHLSHRDLDWIGIRAVLLNAELVMRTFSDLGIFQEVIQKSSDASGKKEHLLIAGGYEPGYSSDTDAVELARVLEAQRIINFSNISYVYSEDPRKNPNAQKFEKLSWEEYRKLVPKEWIPGLSAPFDPVASELAEKYGMKVVILGASLENLEAYLNNENFEGTIIE